MSSETTGFTTTSDALYQLIKSAGGEVFERQTQFKGWNVDNIVQHLHFFNNAAYLSLTDEEAFDAYYESLNARRRGGETLIEATDHELEGSRGDLLLERWREGYQRVGAAFSAADPKMRVKWVGPDMSARSSVSARMMETWAHAQAVYDLLGVSRQDNGAHLRSIAYLGINTFGWSFRNRKKPVPEPSPYVVLSGPSGSVWTWNEPSDADRIEGAAVEFCQVVTQTRNVADTALELHGDTAKRWMNIAQCFAGPPRTPPPPGTRGPNAPSWQGPPRDTMVSSSVRN
ncbi:TIGR03084 family metal-binding protein [uncultured Sulfitobacter sp.]|uniref:TIGR03084 family metal-binding protein n=1 Tax=uncultured Sulfitobacter sp. TaxID=191468 RepID=UPI002620914B|nr:TIGR03084 family metal-binding protein [uncultured Sulfitobacter sp.]